MKYYLSVTAMFRDEGRWMREWIEYHLLLGVEHFYLYDHLSTDRPERILADYLQSGVVELIRIEEDPGGDFQELAIKTYNQALVRARNESRWLALLDVDEFVNPKENTSLAAFLQRYEKYGGVVMNWQMFGTAGVQEVRSNETLLERLTRRGRRELHHNQHVKSIVQPLLTERTVLHFAYYRKGYYAVNAREVKVEGPFDPSLPVEIIQLNHYFVRDRKFFEEVKIPRREGLGVDSTILRQWEADMNEETDISVLRFLAPLRARLGLPSPNFDCEQYVTQYPGLLVSEAVQHWQKIGRFQHIKNYMS